MRPEDSEESYFRFTGKQRLEKSIHLLHGILLGIKADGVIKQSEVKHLIEWLSEHKHFAQKHPFSEVIPILSTAVADGVIDDEEYADLIWITERIVGNEDYWDDITADMQELQGFLRGILADGLILKEELQQLECWVETKKHLRACWPYDELESIIAYVLEDGVIDDQEHQMLVDFFSEFVSDGKRKAVGALDRDTTVSGVCALDPSIEFANRVFCFTGKSERGTHSHLEEAISVLGASFSNSLTKKTDYLIVGADGNPCWAYACYGRKIEKAIENRRNGQKLLIVHEYDFWDSLEDALP